MNAHEMKCMEVWGGNHHADAEVSLGGLDAWVYSQPFQNASEGGDIHYVSSCSSGRITRLLLADVSGHGNAVSESAGKLRQIMRRFVNYINQKRSVEAINKYFSESNDDGQFATAVVISFFSPTRKLTVSTAGHPSPLLFVDRLKKWQILEIPKTSANLENLPLGVIQDMRYGQYKVKLEVGDMLLCYSDALTESRRYNGDFLTEFGLVELANKVQFDHPAQFIPRLLSEIQSENDENLSTDDVTAMLLRANGRRIPFVNTLLAPFRLVRGRSSRS